MSLLDKIFDNTDLLWYLAHFLTPYDVFALFRVCKSLNVAVAANSVLTFTVYRRYYGKRLFLYHIFSHNYIPINSFLIQKYIFEPSEVPVDLIRLIANNEFPQRTNLEMGIRNIFKMYLSKFDGLGQLGASQLNLLALLDIRQRPEFQSPDAIAAKYELLDRYFITEKNSFFATHPEKLLELLIRFFYMFQGSLYRYVDLCFLSSTPYFHDCLESMTPVVLFTLVSRLLSDVGVARPLSLRFVVNIYFAFTAKEWIQIPSHAMLQTILDHRPLLSLFDTLDILAQTDLFHSNDIVHRRVVVTFVVAFAQDSVPVAMSLIGTHDCVACRRAQYFPIMFYLDSAGNEAIFKQYFSTLSTELSERQLCLLILFIQRSLTVTAQRNILKLMLQVLISRRQYCSLLFLFLPQHFHAELSTAFRNLSEGEQVNLLSNCVLLFVRNRSLFQSDVSSTLLNLPSPRVAILACTEITLGLKSDINLDLQRTLAILVLNSKRDATETDRPLCNQLLFSFFVIALKSLEDPFTELRYCQMLLPRINRRPSEIDLTPLASLAYWVATGLSGNEHATSLNMWDELLEILPPNDEHWKEAFTRMNLAIRLLIDEFETLSTTLEPLSTHRKSFLENVAVDMKKKIDGSANRRRKTRLL